jgi:hypothetical protein
VRKKNAKDLREWVLPRVLAPAPRRDRERVAAGERVCGGRGERVIGLGGTWPKRVGLAAVVGFRPRVMGLAPALALPGAGGVVVLIYARAVAPLRVRLGLRRRRGGLWLWLWLPILDRALVRPPSTPRPLIGLEFIGGARGSKRIGSSRLIRRRHSKGIRGIRRKGILSRGFLRRRGSKWIRIGALPRGRWLPR